MPLIFRFLTLVFIFILPLFGSSSSLFAEAKVSSPHVTVELIQKTTSCSTLENCDFGFLFKLEEGWHIYWKNPGDSGAAPKFKFIEPSTLSSTATGHDIVEWPIPKKLPLAHLINYGYENQVMLGFTIPASLIKKNFEQDQKNSIQLYIEGEWLVCKEDCIPGTGNFTTTIPIIDSYPLPSANAHFFDEQLYPKMKHNGRYEINQKELILSIPDLHKSQIELYPVTPGIIENNHLPSVSIEHSQTHLSIPTKLSKVTGSLFFLLKTENNEAFEIEFLPPSIEMMPKQDDGSTAWTILIAVFFAFLGGILLNLMPCVFPVLGLKVLSAIKTMKQNNRSETMLCVTGFLSGVCVSLWLFLIIIFSLRSTGAALGWGFQLQNPYMVGFLCILFLLLTLNLLGLFEFQSSRVQSLGQNLNSKSVFIENFFSGLLTVLVATPCTAPFMGAALGVALSSSFFEGFLIFTALGFGISLPFILLLTIPILRRLLPRPGAWMNWLRKILAVPCLITSCWLGWVLYLQLTPHNPSLEVRDQYGLTWTPYSEEVIEKLQKDNRTIYLDFTAAWCISCQVNKSLVFNNADVLKIIKDKNIALVKADWTNQDPLLTKALSKFGKAGVPLNVVYIPGKTPIQLPSLLTAQIVLNVLKE